MTTTDYIAVIDGSTSKTEDKLSHTMTNGRYCMLMVSDYISSADKNMSCEDFCYGVSEHIRKHYTESQLEQLFKHPIERPTASCVIYSNYRRQVWMIGDCQCMIDGIYYDNPKPNEAVIADKRSKYAKKLLSDGIATINDLQVNDLSRQYIINDLITSTKGQNLDYSVIDGFEIPLDKVKVISISPKNKAIILASDGYPYLKLTLKETELALLNQMKSDPLNIYSFKATKGLRAGNNSFDDRTYIRFVI